MAFIVIEGGEGVGKTTQINLLKEKLTALFPKEEFVFTKEPGGTPFADQIRELVLSDYAKNANAKTMFSIFAAARFEHVERVIAPALRTDANVVCDRFVAATYAYQIVAEECIDLLPTYREQLRLLEPNLPTLTIILDLDPSIALARLAKRKDQPVTHFDAREIAFHERLRRGYKDYAELFAKDTCVFIDAGKSVDEVHQEILKTITAALK